MTDKSPKTWSTVSSTHLVRLSGRQIATCLSALVLGWAFANASRVEMALGGLAAFALSLRHPKKSPAGKVLRCGLYCLIVAALVIEALEDFSPLALPPGQPADQGFLISVRVIMWLRDPLNANVLGLGLALSTIGACCTVARTNAYQRELALTLMLLCDVCAALGALIADTEWGKLYGLKLILLGLVIILFFHPDAAVKPAVINFEDESLLSMVLSMSRIRAASTSRGLSSTDEKAPASDAGQTIESYLHESLLMRSSDESEEEPAEDSISSTTVQEEGIQLGKSSREINRLAFLFAMNVCIARGLGRGMLIVATDESWTHRGALMVAKATAAGVGYLGSRYLGAKQTAMLLCVWAAFLWFGIQLAFVSVAASGTVDTITKFPGTCMFYNALFAFGSHAVFVPLVLVMLTVLHEQSDHRKCIMLAKTVLAAVLLEALTSPIAQLSTIVLLGTFTVANIISLHLIRTTAPKIDWRENEESFVELRGAQAPRASESCAGSVASRQGSTILAVVERQTIANFV